VADANPLIKTVQAIPVASVFNQFDPEPIPCVTTLCELLQQLASSPHHHHFIVSVAPQVVNLMDCHQTSVAC
jgi:hypothetical protein